MTTELTTDAMASMDLEGLAELANESATAAESHAGKAVQAAVFTGRVLIAVKSRMEHGKWLPWLEENWKQSARRAQQFMTLAESNNGALLTAPSVRKALALIGNSDGEKPTKPRPATLETSVANREPSMDGPTLPAVTVAEERPVELRTTERLPIDPAECRRSIVAALDRELARWRPGDFFAVIAEARAAIAEVSCRQQGIE